MRRVTYSNTASRVAVLSALGLAMAAGLAYWGYQNWDEFNSSYYQQGYQQELREETSSQGTTTNPPLTDDAAYSDTATTTPETPNITRQDDASSTARVLSPQFVTTTNTMRVH